MGSDLTSLQLKTTYRSDTDSLLRDFYIPALSLATVYQRSVAYFTSGSLAHAARGVSALVDNGGRLELIASPVLTEEDVDAINQGYETREAKMRRILLERFDLDECSLTKKRLEALAWLVAEDRLDVKIAFRTDLYGRFQRGIYHEKIGVIRDGANNFVSFAGSANESEGGLVTNFESVPVYWSWNDAQGRAAEIENYFKRLWSDSTRGLRVIAFTDVASELLQRYRPSNRPTMTEEVDAEVDADIIAPLTIQDPKGLSLPAHISLRDYQCDVIAAWIRNNGRGVYSLATGTGKTITAIATATRLRVARRLEALLVLCPYQNLVVQWCEELRSFGADPIEAFRSREFWHQRLVGELARPRGPHDPLLTVVTTFATLGTPAFQNLLASFPRQSMLIADEAHHVGSASLHQLLPDRGFPFRLALSATPQRWQDEDGTDRILNWFGPILEPQIGVPDAIRMGALCPYYYTPLFIELDELEAQRYQELTRKIAALLSQGHTFATSTQLAKLLHERSSFIATVKGKTESLKSLLLKEENLSRTLVYCGTGSVDLDGDSAEVIRHVDHIVDVLGNELGVRVAKYTAETSISERGKIIQQLIEKDLQAVVAINCLDEGVDIPCVETAIILSSSTNPRQFVQRRGRVLRKFAGKSHARLFDMVVIPSGNDDPSEGERALMEKELRRYLEFARAAINGAQAERMILPLQDRFGLLHL